MPAFVTVLDSTGVTQTVNTPPALGQALKAASLPVTIASDQGAVTISGTVTANAGTGTTAVSLASLPALAAGAALIGKVGVDQTTPGTTNGVALAQIGANTILTGNGITGTGSQRVTIASDQTAFSVNAVQSGTWNVTNLSQFGGAAINLGAGAVGTGTLRTTQASDSPLVTVTGATTDAAVGNGTAGTLAGYLRSIKDAATDTTTPSPVKVDQTTPGTTNAVALAQVGANTILTGNGVTGTGSQRVTIASDNSPVATTAPTLTKGTQSANGLSVQELKDAGRSCLAMTAEFTFAQVAETLLTMTISAGGAGNTTFGSRTITSGKKFRIQSVSATIESLGSGTAPQRAYLRLRNNTAGATTAASTLQAIWGFVNSTAVVKSGFSMDYEVPDGLEMNGDGTATFGFTLETPDWVTSTATGRIKITVIGFEY